MTISYGPRTLQRYASFDTTTHVINDNAVIMIPYPTSELHPSSIVTVFSSQVNFLDHNSSTYEMNRIEIGLGAVCHDNLICCVLHLAPRPRGVQKFRVPLLTALLCFGCDVGTRYESAPDLCPNYNVDVVVSQGVGCVKARRLYV